MGWLRGEWERGGARLGGAAASPSAGGGPGVARGFGAVAVGDDGAQTYTERKLLGYSPDEIFQVVSRVEDYHEFVPWCTHSVVKGREPGGAGRLRAELGVGFQIFEERYTSLVTVRRPSLVKSEAGDSEMFERLDCEWRFRPGERPGTSWLEFDLAFCFASPLHRRVAGLFVQEVVKKMVSAFEGRCRELYGRPAPC